ncbi:hypothetical protein [[Bacillus] enclensis]|uniref:hypothetical protein n=1 Tax=[Bacillus] enclensis TaxID=1402860 RepID=UPI0018DB21AB|nr:hypothetical protein [[Bacillus] enclensis]MBH9968890.1 hypothetical protein [[Bacillus] enclensis]
MKKGWTSIIGGVILGLIISFFTLEYDGWKIIRHNSEGEVSQVTNEIDVNLITNSFLIIIASGVAIYLALTLIGKVSGKNQKI